LYDSLPSRNGAQKFLSVCSHAALAGLAGQPGSGASAAEGEEEAARAIVLVWKAVALGYRSADAYRTEGALNPLRSRDDFRLLLLDLAFPTEPFVAAR